MNTRWNLIGESCVEYNNRFSRHTVMNKHKTATIRSNSMLQVSPVTNRMNCFILWDLQKQKTILVGTLRPNQLSIQCIFLLSAMVFCYLSVIYWPSTEPSIKRCTWVNKRKNRWALENNITSCPDGSRQSKTGCQSESQLQIEGFGPSVTHGWVTQPRWGRSAAMVERRIWVNITVVPVSNSSLTHNKHHPFENKVWEIYFYKEVCSFDCWSCHYSWLCSRVHLYMRSMQH